jgi:hypothetical protein
MHQNLHSSHTCSRLVLNQGCGFYILSVTLLWAPTCEKIDDKKEEEQQRRGNAQDGAQISVAEGEIASCSVLQRDQSHYEEKY